MDREKQVETMTPPNLNPPVLILFEGLYLGYHSNGVYQLGVVPASQHQFSISIDEFTRHPAPAPDNFLIPVSTQEFVFHEIPPANRRWTFEVVQTNPGEAVLYNSGEVIDRQHPPADETSAHAKDYKWALSMDDGRDFPEHQNSLDLQRGLLNPIIHFKQGLFYNRGFIRRTFRKKEGGQLEPLGAISARVAANLEALLPDANIVLKIDATSEQIFSFKYKAGREYRITVQNAQPFEHDPATHVRSHFPLFYQVLHTAPNKRYDLRAPFAPGAPSLTPHGTGTQTDGGLALADAEVFVATRRGAPNPYRCGMGTVTTPLD